MPVWEFRIVRESVQRRNSDGKRRTIGKYQVFHDGVGQTGAGLRGTTAEAKGPGANVPVNNGKRIEKGRYPLRTHAPGHYATIGFSASTDPGAEPKPCIEVGDTVARTDILIHPGDGFLSSIGCINLCTSLPNANEPIDYAPSRKRVLAVLDDLKAFLGNAIPNKNGKLIPNVFLVIDGEP